MELTLRWAELQEYSKAQPRSSVGGSGRIARRIRPGRRAKLAGSRGEQSLLALSQGGMDRDLRRESRRAHHRHRLSRIRIGGLSVGDHANLLAISFVPRSSIFRDQPRYLMGVGTPKNRAVCAIRRRHDGLVLPTRRPPRLAVHSEGKVSIKQARYAG